MIQNDIKISFIFRIQHYYFYILRGRKTNRLTVYKYE